MHNILGHRPLPSWAHLRPYLQFRDTSISWKWHFLCSIPLRDGTVHMRLLFIVHRLFRLEMVYLRCWYDSKRLRRLFDPYLSWSGLPILGSVRWLMPRCYLWRAGSALLQQWNSSHHSVAFKVPQASTYPYVKGSKRHIFCLKCRFFNHEIWI